MDGSETATFFEDRGACRTPSEKKSGRRYMIEMIGSGIVYAILCIASSSFVETLHGFSRLVVALVPMIGVLGMALALVRFTMRLDELQRQAIVISGSIAALACATLTMLLAFLENAGLPRVPLSVVWPITVITWGLALPFVKRRIG